MFEICFYIIQTELHFRITSPGARLRCLALQKNKIQHYLQPAGQKEGIKLFGGIDVSY